MASLSDYNLCGNVNFTFFLKNLTFIFLTWTCLTYIDMGTFSKSLENKYEHDKIFNINFNRLLARHEQQRKLRYSNLREKLSDHSVIEKNKNISDQISTNSKLSGKRLNYIDVYMKDYEKRYRKMKGISKLDCYCEKRVFDKIHNLYEFGEKLKNKKRFKKYVIVLISIALIPALGLILPILFHRSNNKPVILYWCTKSGCNDSSECNKYTTIHGSEEAIRSIECLNHIFLWVSLITVVLMNIFIFIKVIKYVGLKNGKKNMKAKEYFHVFKEIF